MVKGVGACRAWVEKNFFSERRLLHWSAEQVQSVPNENNRESATLVMQIQV